MALTLGALQALLNVRALLRRHERQVEFLGLNTPFVPLRHRRAFVLRLQGQTYQQIARRLRVSPSTIHADIQRALVFITARATRVPR